MREYRRHYSSAGQTSPVVIANAVTPLLAGNSFADIGCGSGVFGFIFSVSTPCRAAYGVDFAEKAVSLLRTRHIYDEVLLADSARLPLPDRCVDTAISMENLEHLPAYSVANALAELVRIARQRVIVTTPAPWQAVNRSFLDSELVASAADPDPMGYAEYLRLCGYLHISWVTPEQMAQAGFSFAQNRFGAPRPSMGTMVYWAQPESVDPALLGDVGGVTRPEPLADDGRGDWRGAYHTYLTEASALRPPQAPRSLAIIDSITQIRAGLRGLMQFGR